MRILEEKEKEKKLLKPLNNEEGQINVLSGEQKGAWSLFCA